MEIPMKTLEDLSLSELMGEDFGVWVCKNKQYGFDVSIEDKEGGDYIEGTGIHPCAMESMAHFCRQFLYFYEKVT